MKSFTLLQRLLRALAIALVALVIGLAGAGGSYALWNASAATNSATIASGSAALTTTPLSGAPVTLFPGSTSYQTSVITNSGTVPIALTAKSLAVSSAATSFSNSLVVSVGVVTSTSSCNAAFVGVWTGTIGALPATSLATIVPTVSAVIICVTVMLPLAASAASQMTTSPSFVLTIGGTQS